MSLKEEHHGIVVVGGGICGLATALALHRSTTYLLLILPTTLNQILCQSLLAVILKMCRKGISCLVLEKSDTLIAAGTAIGIHANGWKALDQLHVGNILRAKAVLLTEVHEVSLQSSGARTISSGGEFRFLKRSDFIEALASSIPEESFRFGCQVERVEVDPLASFPVLYTSNGAIIRAKVVIGCDGSNTVVARTLGLQAPKSFQFWVVRGFTIYEEGHTVPSNLLMLRGDSRVVGRVPINDKLVHWFLGATSPPKGNFWDGTMTVAGDAMHVMGPFIGQGGSAGLEDSIVLARCLAQEMPHGIGGTVSDLEVQKGVGAALSKYVKERRLRVLRLSTQTYILRILLTSLSGFLKLMCIFILSVFFGGNSLSHDQYDCGTL